MFEAEARSLQALSDPMRLRILSMLKVREACVCELVERLPISQPAVSQHLRRLKDAGLISERRQKIWTFYAIVKQLPSWTEQLLEQIEPCADDALWLGQHAIDTRCARLKPAPQRPGAKVHSA